MTRSHIPLVRRRDVALAVGAGVAVLAIAAVLPNVELLDSHRSGDTALYAVYGERIVDGKLPYRDFYVEYPPGALAAFAVPALGPKGDFTQSSKLIQWALAALTLGLVVVTLALLGAGRAWLFAGGLLVGLSPAALGHVAFTRFDWWPAFLTAAALAALVASRFLLGHAALAAAAVTKVYTAAFLPLTLAHTWRAGRPGRAVLALVAFVVVSAAIVLPFAAIAPGGVGDSLYVQFTRPLQLESLGAAVLLAANGAGVYSAHVVSGSGSDNLSGSLPSALAALTSALEALVLAALWVAFACARRTQQQLVDACVAAALAYVVLGKVLSPQYLIWLVPLVPLLSRPVRVPAAALLGAALVLTQVYFQSRYHDVRALEPIAWVVVARDAVLLALLALVAASVFGGLRRAGARAEPLPALAEAAGRT